MTQQRNMIKLFFVECQVRESKKEELSNEQARLPIFFIKMALVVLLRVFHKLSHNVYNFLLSCIHSSARNGLDKPVIEQWSSANENKKHKNSSIRFILFFENKKASSNWYAKFNLQNTYSFIPKLLISLLMIIKIWSNFTLKKKNLNN